MNREKLAHKFGTVTFEGSEYTLTRQADYSNRVFPGWFGDAQEGEEYTTEFSTDAIDNDGNECQVYWQFDTVKGQEPEDLSNFPFDDEHVTRVWSQ